MVRGEVAQALAIGAAQLDALPRCEMRADFHCVTTWSTRGLCWNGVRFRDFYEQLVLPQAMPATGVAVVAFRGCDGYVSSLPLSDLLAADVLLADRLDGRPLGIEHGAPLRLVAPAHYGYKNVKHLVAIELLRDRSGYRFPWPYPSLMEHPRGRVACEERGRLLPSWLFRLLYRPLITPTAWFFAWAQRRWTSSKPASR